jgi:CRP-like cAMP-binding protein
MLARAKPPETVAAGGLIFSEGDAGEAMFLVTEGTVSLTHDGTVISRAVAPSIFGELALIDNSPRALTATAETDVQLVVIPARHFWVLVHETPYFAQLVMHEMALRLRNRETAT